MLTTAVTLFLIMDPLGNLPIFLAVLSNVAPERRRIVIVRELLIAFVIMTLFLCSGRSVLNVLGLQREAVAIGGAIVLFIIAIRMIFPSRGGVMTDDEDESGEPLIVPLAVPLIAGPSLLATLILLVENAPTHFWSNFAAMLVAWVVSSAILLSAPFFYRLMGHRGLKAIERLMGMILISIAAQMLLNALHSVHL